MVSLFQPERLATGAKGWTTPVEAIWPWRASLPPARVMAEEPRGTTPGVERPAVRVPPPLTVMPPVKAELLAPRARLPEPEWTRVPLPESWPRFMLAVELRTRGPPLVRETGPPILAALGAPEAGPTVRVTRLTEMPP